MAERSIRLSQTLSPFGVGAIYDVLGDSLVACDTTIWKGRGDPLRAPRLEKALGVKALKTPPSRAGLYGAPGSVGVPFSRFPRSLFCPSCRRMTFWRAKMEVAGESPRCGHCASRRPLVPMRFIMVCPDGHMSDVPWHRWAHSHADTPDQRQCEGGALYFRMRGDAGGSLGSLAVECGVARCRAARTLAGITISGAMAQLNLKCSGLQPWQFPNPEAVHEVTPEVVQRGGSNVRFAHVESAIDIPPESRFAEFGDVVLRVTSSDYWPALRSSPYGPLADGLIGAMAEVTGLTTDVVRSVVDQELRGGITTKIAADPDDITGAEWLAFTSPAIEADSRDSFVTRHVILERGELGERQWEATRGLIEMLGKVVLATKLREVRALVGFSRLKPGGTRVAPDLGRGLDWLPAIEVFGEGVFLTLREDAVRRWEAGPVAERMKPIVRRSSNSHLSYWLTQVTPRFVLLHTLAHLLIRQLAFDSGYSSASLRERIYAREPSENGEGQAGVLIYTAAGDAEGTLGGLVRLGEPERLAPSLLAMLQRSLWCSNDPICRDSPGQGVDSLNRAACHACTLVSETSCVYSNVLLDRSLIVGSPHSNVSFFEAPLRLALDRAAAWGTQ